MKDFTVLIPVYNAKEATEFTIRTLYAAAHPHIHEFFIADSSTDGVTSQMLLNLKNEIPCLNIVRHIPSLNHPHAMQNLCSQDIKTPYVFTSDSDVEYYSCRDFDDAVEYFKDPQVAMTGPYYPDRKHPYHEKSILSEYIVCWAMAIRTPIAQKYGIRWLDGLQTEKDGYTTEYDCGAKFFTTVVREDGWKYGDVPESKMPPSHRHFTGQSRWKDMTQGHTHIPIGSFQQHMQNIENEIKLKLQNKTWIQIKACNE